MLVIPTHPKLDKGYYLLFKVSNFKMNVSMMDSYNLTWKIAMTLKMDPKPCLLETYEFERMGIAKYLIEFDRRFSALFSAKAATDEIANANFETEFLLGNKFTRYVKK